MIFSVHLHFYYFSVSMARRPGIFDFVENLIASNDLSTDSNTSTSDYSEEDSESDIDNESSDSSSESVEDCNFSEGDTYMSRNGTIMWQAASPSAQGRRGRANVYREVPGLAPHVHSTSIVSALDFFVLMIC